MAKRLAISGPDDPVAAAMGAFADEIAVLGSDEAKQLDRGEELEVEERESRSS
jgi:hypothetical protein